MTLHIAFIVSGWSFCYIFADTADITCVVGGPWRMPPMLICRTSGRGEATSQMLKTCSSLLMLSWRAHNHVRSCEVIWKMCRPHDAYGAHNYLLVPMCLGSESVAHGNRCLLAPATTALMLTPAVEDVNSKRASSLTPPTGYGMGWFIQREGAGLISGRDYPFVFSHTGGTIGASSVLTVIPEPPCEGGVIPHPHGAESGQPKPHPHGVAVAVIFNLQEVKGMYKLGMQIAEEFHSS